MDAKEKLRKLAFGQIFMSRHTATASSEDERSEFELGGRRELRVLDNEIFLVAMRLGVTPVLIPNTKVKA